jgi:hypothetical protein
MFENMVEKVNCLVKTIPVTSETTITRTIAYKAREKITPVLPRNKSFLLSPSMRFCLNVLKLYSLQVTTITIIARSRLNQLASHAVTCQIWGNRNMFSVLNPV